MVSFVCDKCQQTMKKAKVAQHVYSCGSRYYACVDCNDTFDSEAIKTHSSCISEAEKHQGSMFRGKKVGAAVAPTPTLGANGKPIKHFLDSSSDEEDEAPAKPAAKPQQPPTKKQKTESAPAAPTPAPAAASAPAAAPAAAAASSSFDVKSCVQSLLSKKGGSMSLKKLRKGVLKAAPASAGDKEAVTRAMIDVMLDNASSVRISWSADEDDE